MTLRILFLCLAVVFMFGCGKKKKPDELPPEATANPNAQETTIQSKDILNDPGGSDTGSIPGLYSIHFEYDKSAMTSEGRSLAQKNYEWMKAHGDSNLQIEGHCDRHGSIEYNLALGERRARAVKAYMVNLGANPNRLATVSFGKEKLLDTGETPAADAKNRRANFVVPR